MDADREWPAEELQTLLDEQKVRIVEARLRAGIVRKPGFERELRLLEMHRDALRAQIANKRKGWA